MIRTDYAAGESVTAANKNEENVRLLKAPAVVYASNADSNDITTGSGYTYADFNTGYTIAGNEAAVGDKYEMEVEGVISISTSDGAGTQVKLGSTDILAMPVETVYPADGTCGWKLKCTIQFRTIGATATVHVTGERVMYKASGLVASAGFQSFVCLDSVLTVDSTGDLLFCPRGSWQSGVGTRHFKVKQMTVTKLPKP